MMHVICYTCLMFAKIDILPTLISIATKDFNLIFSPFIVSSKEFYFIFHLFYNA